MLLQLRLTKFWILILIFLPTRAWANLTPTFRTGSQTTNSTSQTVVNEQISSYQYRTGWSYSVSGHNIESTDTDGYINPAATKEDVQTINNVNFQWQAPDIQSTPRWKITTPGQSFSLVESVISPGLDTITNITRTITTTQTTQIETTFGQ